MEEKFIIYKQDDGGVMILWPTEDSLKSHTIEEIAKKDVPEGKPYKIINSNEVPQDPTFRDAWTVDEKLLTDGVGDKYSMFADDPFHPDNTEKNKMITVDIEKAKELVKEKLRIDRKPLLEAQDALFMKAQESNSDTTAIVAEKQRLRDITNDVDAMTTEAQLKAKLKELENE